MSEQAPSNPVLKHEPISGYGFGVETKHGKILVVPSNCKPPGGEEQKSVVVTIQSLSFKFALTIDGACQLSNALRAAVTAHYHPNLLQPPTIPTNDLPQQ